MHILRVPSQKGGTFFMLACCFIGHRKIEITDNLINLIKKFVSDLLSNGVEIFYFGSRSDFNGLCYDIVTEFKKSYPNIQRVYVRAEYRYVSKAYTDYLLQFYEETFYPPLLEGGGKTVYVKRNQLMIDASDYCVFYFNPDYTLSLKLSKYGFPIRASRSGTKLAYEYAVSKNKILFNAYQK